MKKIISLTLAVSVVLFPISVFASAFSDVLENDNYYYAISHLANIGVISGYEDGEFKSSNNITRAEFSTIMCRISDFDVNDSENNSTFTDIKIGDWYYTYVEKLHSAHIIDGFEDNTFRPNDNIRLRDAIKIVVSAVGKETDAIANGGYPNGYIKAAADSSYVNDVIFDNTDDFATRGQISQLIYNVFESEKTNNIQYIINKICEVPRPVGSDSEKEVRRFLSDKLDEYGFDVTIQEFGYVKVLNAQNIHDEICFDVGTQQQDGISANIIAKKKASVETNKSILITAHYDTTEQVIGVIDNGSGVSALMEIARQLAGIPVNYNIEFILFSAEENNMGGSQYYASKLQEQEKGNICLAINLDSIGEKNEYMPQIATSYGIDEEKFIASKIPEFFPERMDMFNMSRTAILSLSEILNEYNMKIESGFGAPSDNISLERAWIPAVTIYQRSNNKTITDINDFERLDNIDISKVAYVVRIVKKIISANLF